MRTSAKVALLLLVLGISAAVLAAPFPGSARPTASSGTHLLTDPYEIYGRSVAMTQANPAPPFASYVLQVSANHFDLTRDYDASGAPTTTLHFGLGHAQAAYRVWYRASDVKTLMQDVQSSDVSVVPPVPWPLDFTDCARDCNAPVNEKVRMGSVTVNQMAKLLSSIAVDQHDQYRITLAGVETDNGQPAYHLLLQNVAGDPNQHPLRELFVDTRSFRVRQVVLEVGQHGPLFGGSLQLRAHFSMVGPYWINTDGEVAGGGHYAFLHLNGSYAFHASNFDFPKRLPSWYFNASAFKLHAATVAHKPFAPPSEPEAIPQ